MARPRIYQKRKRADILSKNISDYGDFLTPEQAAFVLNCTRNTLYLWLNDEEMNFPKLQRVKHGKILIPKQSLLKFMGVEE